MTTKQITVDEATHEALKAEAKRRGMTLQGFVAAVLETGLRVKRVELVTPEEVQ